MNAPVNRLAPTDWTELFYGHYFACAECRGPDLCAVGHVMVQFAGMQRHEAYLREIAQHTVATPEVAAWESEGGAIR